MDLSLLKRPSALLPLGLAAAALTLPYILVAIFGPDPTGDEGVGAHTWQLLMLAQAVSIVVFAAVWLPRTPGPALAVIGLQVLAAFAAAAPVFLLGL
jgi:hypothetical protein